MAETSSGRHTSRSIVNLEQRRETGVRGTAGAGEQVHAAYQLVRDALVFTDRRLILVDKQGMTGRKVEYHTRCRTGTSRSSASRPQGPSVSRQSERSYSRAFRRPSPSNSARVSTSTRCRHC